LKSQPISLHSRIPHLSILLISSFFCDIYYYLTYHIINYLPLLKCKLHKTLVICFVSWYDGPSTQKSRTGMLIISNFASIWIVIVKYNFTVSFGKGKDK
jgi:hypothetical protein